jgi:tripartite-type tricarboxylate transporter receptor subunit TctC
MKNPYLTFAISAVGISVLLSIFLVCAEPIALAQTRTIRFVIPFPAGGSVDILARFIGEQITKAHGTNILVENRPGSGTVVATEAVSRATPDGNTVLFMANSFVINSHLRKLNYDPLTNFEPVCHLVNSPQVIAVKVDAPYKTLAELIDAAKSKPGEFSLASVGPSTTQHIGALMFQRATGTKFVYVPFPGGGPAVNALLGGHVTAVLQNYAETQESLKAGKLRALAATSSTRIESLPDVPTVSELGYRGFEVVAWFGNVVPAKTPKEIVVQLAAWSTQSIQVPDVRAKLANISLFPVGRCGADFADHLRKQSDEYGRAIRDANLKED